MDVARIRRKALGILAFLALLWLLASGVSGCDADGTEDPKGLNSAVHSLAEGGPGGGPIAGSMTVTVVSADTGSPIPGAFVMVGDGPEPGDWNWGTTDGSGQITLSDPSLIGPVAITAGSDAYSWLTLFDLNADAVTMPLGLRDRTVAEVTMSGDLSGITFANNDGYYDFGVVIEPLRFNSLLTFNFNDLLAPGVQRCFNIPFSGQQCFDVPGNLYAPNQVERFLGFFNMVILMTPFYVPVEMGVQHRLGAMIGRVNKDELLNLISNPDFEIADIAAMIDLRQVGISTPFTPASPYVKDFSATNTVSESLTATIANFPAQSDVFTTALADIDNLEGRGDMLVSGFAFHEGGGSPASFGLKRINTGGSIPSYDSLCATISMGQSGASIEGAITAQVDRNGNSTAFMQTPFGYLTDFSQTDRTFDFNDPQESWSPGADLVQGRFFMAGGTNREYFWEFAAPGGQTQITLPDLPDGIRPPFENPTGGEHIDCELSVTAMTYGPSFNYHSFDFDSLEDGITHLSFRTFSNLTNPYPSCASSAECSDGVFCNGAEVCSPVTSQCESGPEPCGQSEFCNESTDTCDLYSICLDVNDACLTLYLLIDPPNSIFTGSGLSCSRGIFPAYAKVVHGGWLAYLDYEGQGFPPDCSNGDFALIRGQGSTAAMMEWVDCAPTGPTPLTAVLCGQDRKDSSLKELESFAKIDWNREAANFLK